MTFHHAVAHILKVNNNFFIQRPIPFLSYMRRPEETIHDSFLTPSIGSLPTYPHHAFSLINRGR